MKDIAAQEQLDRIIETRSKKNNPDNTGPVILQSSLSDIILWKDRFLKSSCPEPTGVVFTENSLKTV